MTGAQRKLAAILVADVVGYARLAGSDEQGTLGKLGSLRRDVIEPTMRRFSGRLFKAAGDGFLVEFASAVEAVRAALSVQEANRDGPLQLRIGIHLGDVVVEGDDLMGDGVNIAARIEGVADSGGIAISRAVHEQVRDKLEIGFEDRGEMTLKNLTRPVHVFAFGGARSTTPPAVALALPDKPSIAVLPFQNMSGDREQEYFVDGLVEDIITALSRFKSLFVIARNSSFTYKDKTPDLRQVGRELGVRYVLEGSVRKSGNRLRITSQLIEAADNTHIWADRFEGELEDVFALQDQVTAKVVGTLAPRIEWTEIERARRKPAGSMQTYDLVLRAQALSRNRSRGNVEAAFELLRKAIALEPDNARALAYLANFCWFSVAQGFWHRDHPAVVDMVRLAEAALALDSNDSEVLSAAGFVLALPGGDLEGGLALAERATNLNPNDANAFRIVGILRAYEGEPDKAIQHMEDAIRLNPLDSGPSANVGLLLAHFGTGNHEAVVEASRRILRERPDIGPALRYRAASLAHLGRVEEARQVVGQLLDLTPAYTVSEARRHHEFDMNGAFRKPGVAKALYDGLRLAGLPE